MSKTGSKILGTFFFVLLIFLLFYLILLPKKMIKKRITKIELIGNNFLLQNDYLKQTKLLGVSDYNELSLAVIKDRLEKHPYISKADVETKGKEINAYITERKMIGLILKGTELYFVSDNFEILPLMPNTKLIDLPVISNPDEKIKPFDFIKNEDLIDAVKIIETTKLIDDAMLNRLSEINLRNGGDIILTFSGYHVPVILGRGNEAKKMVYLESFLKNQNLNEMAKNTSYIDLRFAGNIYIGPSSSGQNTGTAE